jgi:hypothetical protein
LGNCHPFLDFARIFLDPNKEQAMNIHDKLSSQIACVGLPLFAVSLTAVPYANTPALLMLHWHGFRKNPDREYQLRGIQPAPVPSSALQINEPWTDVPALDRAMLDTAWRLGAWELEREQRRACEWIGASETESLACRQAFADHPMRREDDWVTEAPDRDELMRLGARAGYVRWIFRPVFGGIWGGGAHDETLGEDGGRMPPCPVPPLAHSRSKNSTFSKYRLGYSSRIVLT